MLLLQVFVTARTSFQVSDKLTIILGHLYSWQADFHLNIEQNLIDCLINSLLSMSGAGHD